MSFPSRLHLNTVTIMMLEPSNNNHKDFYWKQVYSKHLFTVKKSTIVKSTLYSVRQRKGFDVVLVLLTSKFLKIRTNNIKNMATSQQIKKKSFDVNRQPTMTSITSDVI